MNKFQEGPEFYQGGRVAHQQEQRFRMNSYSNKVDDQIYRLKFELRVDEEYDDAVGIACRLLKFYIQFKVETPKKLKYYAAAALYFGFRYTKAPFLLNEISSKISSHAQVDVARIYLKLFRFLNDDLIDRTKFQLSEWLEYIDPSIYIQKFVKALELRDKQKEIVDVTTKIIKVMQKENMIDGRRPSGLCGAAIAISAKICGQNISSQKICQIAQICDQTFRKRLAEFNQTEFAQLTIQQFEFIENVETDYQGNLSDPPAFKRLKEKEEKLSQSELQQQEEERQKQINKMIEQLKDNQNFQFENQNIKQNSIRLIPQTEEKQNSIKEELSSLSEQEVLQYIKTPSEIKDSEMDWLSNHKEDIQFLEDQNKKKQMKKLKQKLSTKNKEKQVRIIFQSSTPMESLNINFQKEGINNAVVENLFEHSVRNQENLLNLALKEVSK